MIHYKKNKRALIYIIIALVFSAFVITLISLLVHNSKKNNNSSSSNETSMLSTENTNTSSTIDTTSLQTTTTSNVKQADPNSPYDFSKPVPEGKAVEDTYFNDAVFVGNSITEGFYLYTGLSNATAYTEKGLMVNTFFTDKCVNLNGKKVTVLDALKTNPKFSKVYIMLGINELGWAYPNLFIDKYTALINEIKNINPNATIYIQSILPVSKAKSDNDSIFNINRINQFNTLIRAMTEKMKIYYIDVGSGLADSDGYLPEGTSYDGIHLKVEYCKKWLAYLKCHTVK